MTEPLMIKNRNVSLEAAVSLNGGSKGVVITHPHPLYGGDMDNPVVHAICTAYENRGFSTLRFNFRGVGRSAGTFDNGLGEAEDLCAAIEFLSSSGITDLCLSGYSFGTWVNARADLQPFQLRHMTMVSPPVAFMDFEGMKSLSVPSGAVTGTRDEIAPPDRVRQWLAAWNPDAALRLIEHADHFYSGYQDKLVAELTSLIDSLKPAR